MRLQELVDSMPDLRKPVDDCHQVVIDHSTRPLFVRQTPFEVATEEPENRFDVVGVQDETEILVELEVHVAGSRTSNYRLIHRPNDVRTETSKKRHA